MGRDDDRQLVTGGEDPLQPGRAPSSGPASSPQHRVADGGRVVPVAGLGTRTDFGHLDLPLLGVEGGQQVLGREEPLPAPVPQPGAEVVGVVPDNEQRSAGGDGAGQSTYDVDHAAVGQVQELRGHQIPPLFSRFPAAYVGAAPLDAVLEPLGGCPVGGAAQRHR